MKCCSLFLLPFLAVFGCSREPSPATPPTDDHSGPAHKPSEEHGEPAGGHEHTHGERIDAGEAKIGDLVVHAYQIVKPVPGKEADFDLDFAPGTTMPVVVRGWIGVESGKGSMKVRFEKETDLRMHGHPETPDPLVADARLWVEIETKTGVVRGSFALPK